MIRTVFASISLLLVGLLVAACTMVTGSGRIVTEERSVGSFSGIALSGSGVLTIEQGDETSLVVEADDNLMEWIETEVRSGTLHLGFKPGANLINPSRSIQFRVTTPNLDAVDISGSGTVRADQIVAERFTATISGSGDMEIGSLTTGEVNVTISGSGDMQVAGAAQTQRITVSGSGSYEAGDLASESATITISGSGSATLWAAEAINIDVSGSGNVAYYGTPRINQQTSGSGRVNSLGDK